MRSVKTYLAALIALCFAGCTQGEANLYRSSNQPRTIEHGLSVTVTNVASRSEALPFAERYCAAHDRMARFERMQILSYHSVASQSALFDCVQRPS